MKCDCIRIAADIFIRDQVNYCGPLWICFDLCVPNMHGACTMSELPHGSAALLDCGAATAATAHHSSEIIRLISSWKCVHLLAFVGFSDFSDSSDARAHKSAANQTGRQTDSHSKSRAPTRIRHGTRPSVSVILSPARLSLASHRVCISLAFFSFKILLHIFDIILLSLFALALLVRRLLLRRSMLLLLLAWLVGLASRTAFCTHSLAPLDRASSLWLADCLVHVTRTGDGFAPLCTR